MKEAEAIQTTAQQALNIPVVSHRYLIQVISKQTNQVVHEIPCKSYIGADRVQDGVELNMDHELYYTKLVTL